ncbi:hypothetical protein GCM10027060_06930 [Nesterenkonia halophila]|uniref:hypothetical protein n=1 Tax=Nesterenkonia halophila TaxID=302044 RepID=UPI001291AFDF|nr:hypothetical protein [Nesterenkonia halophila]
MDAVTDVLALGAATTAEQAPSETSAAGDMLLMVLTGVMWALSLAALAGAAWLMGRWMQNREARRRAPAEGDDAGTTGGRRPGSRAARRSVRRGKRRQDNASDLDGWA